MHIVCLLIFCKEKKKVRKCVEALQFFMNVVSSQSVLTARLVLIKGSLMIITV